MSNLIDRGKLLEEINGKLEYKIQYTLENIILSLHTQNQWISVKDKLPEKGDKVLFLNSNNGDLYIYNIGKGNEYQYYTHWMRIPPKP